MDKEEQAWKSKTEEALKDLEQRIRDEESTKRMEEKAKLEKQM